VICLVVLALVSGTLRFTFSYSTSTSSPRDVAEDYLHGPAWKPFTATDGEFTATFPTFPVRESGTSTVGGVTVDSVEYLTNPTSDDTFAVLVVTFPRDATMASAREFLNNTANAGAAAIHGTITRSHFLHVQGYPAIDFAVDGSRRGHELIVLVDHMQYSVAVIGSASAMSAYNRFVDSFHLLQ
jgi:hypothetical protein